MERFHVLTRLADTSIPKDGQRPLSPTLDGLYTKCALSITLFTYPEAMRATMPLSLSIGYILPTDYFPVHLHLFPRTSRTGRCALVCKRVGAPFVLQCP